MRFLCLDKPVIIQNHWYNKVYSCVLLSCALSTIKAQTNVRPYKEWEATQFVAVSGHQPEDYVLTDNNWEIMYNLRTPHTQSEIWV